MSLDFAFNFKKKQLFWGISNFFFFIILALSILRGKIQKGAQVTVFTDFTKFILPLSYNDIFVVRKLQNKFCKINQNCDLGPLLNFASLFVLFFFHFLLCFKFFSFSFTIPCGRILSSSFFCLNFLKLIFWGK